MTRTEIGISTLAAFLVASMAVPSGRAFADPPSLDDSGLFAVVQADISPPKASANRQRRGAGLRFSYFSGNMRTGEPSSGMSGVRRLEIRSPRGFRFHYRAFPSCRLTATWDPSDCPRRSVLGSGSAIADGRPFLPDFIHVRGVLIFNGKLTNGRPALLLSAKVFGVGLVVPFEPKPARGRFGPALVFDGGPQPVPEGAFVPALVSVDVEFPRKAASLRGRQVHLWETATSCQGSWLVQAVVTTYKQQRLAARDRIPCIKP